MEVVKKQKVDGNIEEKPHVTNTFLAEMQEVEEVATKQKVESIEEKTHVTTNLFLAEMQEVEKEVNKPHSKDKEEVAKSEVEGSDVESSDGESSDGLFKEFEEWSEVECDEYDNTEVEWDEAREKSYQACVHVGWLPGDDDDDPLGIEKLRRIRERERRKRERK